MILTHSNSVANGLTISAMNVYNEDSIGRRIAWARKNVDWTDSNGEHHIGMTGHQLGRRLVTQGTATGVRNVYVSQLENNHASPSLPMLRKIAEVTGVTVGFLLMETDYPYRGGTAPEPEPIYLSPEADTVAKIVDDASPAERARILAVVQAMADATAPADTMPQRNEFAARLVASDRVSLSRNVIRA